MFPSFYVYGQVVSLFCLRFVPLPLVLFYSRAFEASLILAGWGAELLEEGYPEWAPARNVAKDLLCFLFFLLLQLAASL